MAASDSSLWICAELDAKSLVTGNWVVAITSVADPGASIGLVLLIGADLIQDKRRDRRFYV